MMIHVKILGALTKPFGKDDFDFEVAERATMEELLLKLGYRLSHARYIITSVNGTQVKLGYALQDKDDVALVLPASGG